MSIGKPNIGPVSAYRASPIRISLRPQNMSSEEQEHRRTLKWLTGVARVGGGGTLPLMACASKSALHALDRRDGAKRLPTGDGERAAVAHGGLRLIINDDHGMTPTVTIVNRTDAPVRLCAVEPALLGTDHGTYDLHALLLAHDCPVIECGTPLVFRIVDIGRNADEPFRESTVSPAPSPSCPGA